MNAGSATVTSPFPSAAADQPRAGAPDGDRWIVFDAVGTLIRAVPGVAPVYHAVGRKHGSRLGLNEVRQRFREAFQAEENIDRHGPGRLRTSESRELTRWRNIVRRVLSDAADPETCFTELWQHFGQARAWACFDDVAPLLEQLAARNVRLAIASNFDRRLHGVCDGLAPLRRIERRIISSEAGWRKPAAEFFEAVVRATGVPAASILFVGDDGDNDVRGSLRSGLRAVHLLRDAEPSQDDSGVVADVPVIRSLLELREWFP